jgi:hypothetical protein
LIFSWYWFNSSRSWAAARGRSSVSLTRSAIDQEKAKLRELAAAAEEWLYSEEGEDATKSKYVELLVGRVLGPRSLDAVANLVAEFLERVLAVLGLDQVRKTTKTALPVVAAGLRLDSSLIDEFREKEGQMFATDKPLLSGGGELAELGLLLVGRVLGPRSLDAVANLVDSSLIDEFREKEGQMFATDKLVIETEDRKNALEELLSLLRVEPLLSGGGELAELGLLLVGRVLGPRSLSTRSAPCRTRSRSGSRRRTTARGPPPSSANC